MPTLKLPLTAEQFRQLPRNAAYQYDYHSGEAWLTPRARVEHARLDFATLPQGWANAAPAHVSLRRVRHRDWEALGPLFGAAFQFVQPFGSLDNATLDVAARACLTRTRMGGDGPRVRCASFVALRDDQLLGAALITLIPAVDPANWDAFHWAEPPPSDLLQRRGGQPHLTWIFVAPREKGTGVGSALLAAAVNVLRQLGYAALFSTFFTANEPSLLWHWRHGFTLLEHPGSRRPRRNYFDVSSGLLKSNSG